MKLSKLLLAISLTTASLSATGNECSLYGNTKGAINCLNAKVVKLEKQLAKNTQPAQVPIGAIVAFNRNQCPKNWVESSALAAASDSTVIYCEKVSESFVHVQR